MPTTNRKTRIEPPTLDEAIYAAQGLSSDPGEQTRIASALMGLPEAEVRAQVLQAVGSVRQAVGRPAGRPAIVVERRAPRLPRR
jgi:hypothetical protein